MAAIEDVARRAGCIRALTDLGSAYRTRWPARRSARAAARILARIQNGVPPPEREIIRCSIIERQSV